MAVDSSIIDPARFNPLASNRFLTREDTVRACHALFEPLLPYFSPGKARVQLDASTSTWDRAACDLEAWARPLFGIVPMVAGGEPFSHWNVYREGLKNGTNPEHPEYWGEAKSMDQRHVEATAIGLALLLVPEHIWEPLDDRSKGRVAEWLLTSRNGEHARNNHMFFRICTYVQPAFLLMTWWSHICDHEHSSLEFSSLCLRQKALQKLRQGQTSERHGDNPSPYL